MNKGIAIKFGGVIITILLFTVRMQAQLNSCNAFLKGNYLEVGINWNGAYGTSNPPPAGYHPDTLSAFYNCAGLLSAPDTALGFVADPDKDGWNVGAPKYYGDYILPGTHQEGWSLMADGTQINEWNYFAADSSALEGGMTLYDTTYRSGPTGDTSKWEGSYQDHLFITQFTVLDTSKLFFTVNMYIDNTSIAASNNIYYMRTIKADNDALLPGGNYISKNKIAYQLPNKFEATAVSATSTLYPKAYVALGSGNPNATCFLIKNMAAPFVNTIDNISAETDTNYLYTANDSLTDNSGIGIIFNLGTIVSGGEDTFSFVYAFSPAALSEALGITDSAGDTLAHAGINNVMPVHYNLYPNPVKTTFSITGLTINDHVQLYDELGKNVTQYLTGTSINTFTTGYLPAGFYILVVKDTEGTVLWKTPFQQQ